ncbi:MAG: sulfite exporter TauE/SafE family protein [Paludibacterium sp.]|uniref:sulfite exporter TauE/SafE family protein n=1 Tax=Paludibacterium sp. TaxID=1917523 RepID=UPI0025ED8387|nr:sulfite exporter TauE/SafE family protein [Paludibacterium sp.]MBV8048105.1 sulfite exporter TauE/SafE family protein [Paludibacterium sp.]MBV8647023.1 sulfite exporter TauE/SafE family protein [Paludibacterium sp.]
MITLSYTLAGALTGLLVGMTGVGAGAMMTPVLLLVFGVAPATAIATDLWFSAITKIVGAGIHHAGGQVDWPIVKKLWLGSLPVALGVALLVSLGGLHQQVSWLNKAIGVVVILTALGLFVAPRIQALAGRHGQSERSSYWTVLCGAFMGLCVALTSAGAGTLGSVALLALFPRRMTPHRLVATDLAHAIPLTLLAGLGYLFLRAVDWPMLLSLLLGSIPAIVLGSLLAQRLPGRALQLLLALVLISAGVKLVG